MYSGNLIPQRGVDETVPCKAVFVREERRYYYCGEGLAAAACWEGEAVSGCKWGVGQGESEAGGEIPDISSTSTCFASSFSVRVWDREAGVTPDVPAAAAAAACVSVSAAAGAEVEVEVEEVEMDMVAWW